MAEGQTGGSAQVERLQVARPLPDAPESQDRTKGRGGACPRSRTQPPSPSCLPGSYLQSSGRAGSGPVPLAGLFAEWSCSQSPRTAQGPARAVPSAAAGRGDPGMLVSRGWGSSGEPRNQGKENHQSLGLRGTLELNRAFTGPRPKWGPPGEEQGGLIWAGRGRASLTRTALGYSEWVGPGCPKKGGAAKKGGKQPLSPHPASSAQWPFS